MHEGLDADREKDMIQAAVNSGNVEMTRYLLGTSTFNISQSSYFLKQLALSAVYSSSVNVLSYLLEVCPWMLHAKYAKEFDGDKMDDRLLIHYAAEVGSHVMIECLVRSGLNVKDCVTSKGLTVLGIAARNGNLNVVDHLLNSNSAEDMLSLGAEPIVGAGAGGSIDIFKALVNVGFNPLQQNIYGETTLHAALMHGKEKLAFYIMEQYPTLKDINGKYARSPLHYAAAGGNVALLKHLIDIGLDTRYVDWYGCTILHIACLNRQKDVVKYMIQFHGYLRDMKDKFNKSALHFASQGGDIGIFVHLCNAGMNVNARTKNMNTMLHRACTRRNYEMINYLLHHYIGDMNQPDNDGGYPFHTAARLGDDAVLRIFIKHNVDICKLSSEAESILHISCIEGNFDTTQFILTHFPQLINLQDSSGKTAMEYAVDSGAVDIVKLFRKMNT